MALLHRCTHAWDEEGLKESFDSMFKQFLTYMAGSYNVFTVKVFEAWVCEELPDGTSILSGGPDVECWTSPTHVGMLLNSVIFMLLYVVGIPLFFGVVLYIGVNQDLLAHPRFLRTFDFLCAPLRRNRAQRPADWAQNLADWAQESC